MVCFYHSTPKVLKIKSSHKNPMYFDIFEEGKKIGWKDGFRAIWCIIKYNSFIK
jgi:hypothetical protein